MSNTSLLPAHLPSLPLYLSLSPACFIHTDLPYSILQGSQENKARGNVGMLGSKKIGTALRPISLLPASLPTSLPPSLPPCSLPLSLLPPVFPPSLLASSLPPCPRKDRSENKTAVLEYRARSNPLQCSEFSIPAFADKFSAAVSGSAHHMHHNQHLLKVRQLISTKGTTTIMH